MTDLENEDMPLAAQLECGGSAGGMIEEEVLAWAPDKTGRFRLQRELHRWSGYVDVDMPGGPWFPDRSTHECEARPLIECKFDVRKRLHGRLPDFLRSLGSELAMTRPSDSDIWEALETFWNEKA